MTTCNFLSNVKRKFENSYFVKCDEMKRRILLWDIIIIMLYEVMLIFLLALALCYTFAAKCSQQMRADY